MGRGAGDGCQVVSSPIPGLKLIEHQRKDCEAESITNHSFSALVASEAAQGPQRPSRSQKLLYAWCGKFQTLATPTSCWQIGHRSGRSTHV